MRKALGINLGTSVTSVYVEGKGITVREPNAVAVNTSSMEVVAIGNEAMNIYNKAPGAVELITHIYQGNVSDYDRMELIIEQVFKKTGVRNPDVVFAVHGSQSPADMAAIINMMLNAGAKDIFTVDLPTVVVLGSDQPLDDDRELLLCDIGAASAEIGIVKGCATKLSRTVQYGCNKLDKAIISYIKSQYRSVITERAARSLREAIGSVHPSYSMGSYELNAVDMLTGLPRKLSLTSKQTTEAMKPFADYLISNIDVVLKKLPEPILNNVKSRGILLTGGGALDGGLKTLMEETLEIPVQIAHNAPECAVEGLGKIIEHPEIFGVLLRAPIDD